MEGAMRVESFPVIKSNASTEVSPDRIIISDARAPSCDTFIYRWCERNDEMTTIDERGRVEMIYVDGYGCRMLMTGGAGPKRHWTMLAINTESTTWSNHNIL